MREKLEIKSFRGDEEIIARRLSLLVNEGLASSKSKVIKDEKNGIVAIEIRDENLISASYGGGLITFDEQERLSELLKERKSTTLSVTEREYIAAGKRLDDKNRRSQAYIH